jgi:hypothetical protein
MLVGDLRFEDEFMHQATGDLSFNESMMFNFFDSTLHVGGFVRIGNRVNEGHAEMTFCVFLPDGELLLQWAKPSIDSNGRFDAAGLRFEVLEAGKQLTVSYEGPAVRLKNPMEMRNPGVALRSNPKVAVRLTLEISGIGPMIGSATGNPAGSVIFLDGVGHYQQALVANGSLEAGGDGWQLRGMFGARDHSWGRRVWSSIYRDRSVWVTFGADLAFICCKTWLGRSVVPDTMGCVIEGDEVTPFTTLDFQSHFVPGTSYHDRVGIRIEDVRGRHFNLEGHVDSYVPLRHRAAGRETVFLGQAMTRFVFAERSSLGLSEYFDAESACPELIELSEAGGVAVE